MRQKNEMESRDKDVSVEAGWLAIVACVIQVSVEVRVAAPRLDCQAWNAVAETRSGV